MKQITAAEAIQRTVEHREVFHDEMLHIMRQIMRGELTPAQIAAHDLAHDVQPLGVEHLAVLDGALDCFCHGDLLHARLRLMKLSSISRPCSVSRASG